ncbi:hypothetical protein MTR_3g118440 [Medicago truncatula]|uniref:Uncharacterized protein n=1 Tax=Medicago truncatula TaxID=3880 RepID=G7J9A3_MEDTR|nr:hypothetical protein MTR_3g118440 [Medicago truncatula]
MTSTKPLNLFHDLGTFTGDHRAGSCCSRAGKLEVGVKERETEIQGWLCHFLSFVAKLNNFDS